MDTTELSHGDRLTPAQLEHVREETLERHRRVGALLLLDGPVDVERLRTLVASRLHLLPRHRQRVLQAPLGVGQARWVDDERFDLDHHLRHSALPQPGSMAQLTAWCARVMARPLDPSRPLWELYVVEGLSDGRTALLGITHQALLDTASSLDLLTVLLDAGREAPDPDATLRQWQPRPRPGVLTRAGDLAGGVVASPVRTADGLARVVADPVALAREGAAVAVRVLRRAVRMPSAPSVFHGTPGRYRRHALATLPVEDLRTVHRAYDVPVTDVLVAVVADAIGRWLRTRGHDTTNQWLRMMVPVSTGSDALVGGDVASTFVTVPVGEVDPLERLQVVADAAASARAGVGAMGVRALRQLAPFAPPTLHAAATRVAGGSSVYDVLLSNVPGPERQVELLGTEVVAAHPLVPLVTDHTFAVAATSVAGGLHVGVTADLDAVPDVEVLPDLLAASLADLHRCAEAELGPLGRLSPVGDA